MDNRLRAARRDRRVNEYQVYNITRDREINIYDYFLGWYFRSPFLIKVFIKTVSNLCPEI